MLQSLLPHRAIFLDPNASNPLFTEEGLDLYFKKHGPSLELVLPGQSGGGCGPQPGMEAAEGSGNTAPLPISPLQRK